jgi:hypothetical protein
VPRHSIARRFREPVNSTSRRAAALLLLAAAGWALTGCDSAAALHRDVIQVQISADGGLLIAICEDVSVEHGYGSVRDDVTGEWVSFWEAEELATLDAGEVGRAGEMPFGLTATKDDVPAIGAGDAVAVQLVPPDGTSAYSIIKIDDLAAVTGKWVDSDGKVSTTSCSG